MDDALTAIWIPAGIIFAFQIQMVRWRIDREVSMESSERIWLPLCDYLNLLSMITTAAIVFVLPVVLIGENIASAVTLAKCGMALSAILLIGYLLALIGHYRLFIGGVGPRPYAPTQEVVIAAATVLLAALYVASVWPAFFDALRTAFL